MKTVGFFAEKICFAGHDKMIFLFFSRPRQNVEKVSLFMSPLQPFKMINSSPFWDFWALKLDKDISCGDQFYHTFAHYSTFYRMRQKVS